jgi:hypothetical protein
MAPRPTRVATRHSALGLSVLLILSALALPAVAADDTGRSYTASISPMEVCSGVEEAFTLTLTNTSTQQRLGSARIAVPAEVVLSTDGNGANDLAVKVSRQRGPATTPIASYDDNIDLISLDNLSAAPGATVTVTFTATASGPDETAVEFRTQAKQANDFNSTSDTANELVLVGSQPSTTIVSCGALKFVEQPGDTSVGVAIPGADGGAGPRVAIVDASGVVIPTASASITIARTDGGPFSAGTLTQATANGIATFAGLKIAAASTYTLTAFAAGFDPVHSETFEVFPFGDTCEEGRRCSTTLTGSDGSTLLSGTASGGTGALLGSSAPNGNEVCGDPLDYDPGAYSYLPNQVTIGGTNLVNKLVEFRVSKEYDQRQANNGVSFYQVCAEPLAPFTEFSTFVDIFGNRVVNPADIDNLRELGFLDENDGIKPGVEFQTSGFLPNCASATDTPCVESRVKRGGGPVITVRWGSRWTMR